MTSPDKVFGVAGIISLLGAIIGGLAGQAVAAYSMIGLVLLLWLSWLSKEVTILRKLLPSTDLEPELKLLPKPTAILHEKKNRLKIQSDFLLWEKCSIMFWVRVPPKGEGLRDSPENRYLIAHATGKVDKDGHRYYNQFTLRHTAKYGNWNLTTSNDAGKYASSKVAVKDELSPGWHHFLLAWDKDLPRLLFAIDGGAGGNDISVNAFECWPERLADNAVVGAFIHNYGGHYCNTEISNFLLYRDFLNIDSTESEQHLRRRPAR